MLVFVCLCGGKVGVCGGGVTGSGGVMCVSVQRSIS